MSARRLLLRGALLCILAVLIYPSIVSANVVCCKSRTSSTCRPIDPITGSCSSSETRSTGNTINECCGISDNTIGSTTTSSTQYNCCLLPPVGSQAVGRCEPITTLQAQNTCTNSQGVLSTELCTNAEQCIEWESAVDINPIKSHQLIKFIPSLSIPGSSIFNEGEPIIVTGETMGEYIAAIYVFLVSVAGILAAVFIMYGGVRYVISRGNQQAVAGAKETISSALVGLLIALTSYIILLTINPNLVQFNGFKLEYIKPLQNLEQETSTEHGAGYVVSADVSQFDNCITEAAAAAGIDRDWLKALMLVESRGDPRAKSKAGAYGLVQLLPSTAQTINPSVTAQQLFNPAINLQIAAKYYAQLLYKTCPLRSRYKSGQVVSCDPTLTNCTNGNPKYANAAYNGGVGANCSSITCSGMTWWECPANDGYKETREYVGRVQAAYEKIVASNSSATDTAYDWDMNTPTCSELQQQYQ